MNWQPYPDYIPHSSGIYIISINKPIKNGNIYTFGYFSHYNAESAKWHKYDPFTETIGERIDLKINAWIRDFAIYT